MTTDDLKPLLCTRRQAAEMIGTGIPTIKVLQQNGKLTPIKLSGTDQSTTYFAVSEVQALVEEMLDEAKRKRKVERIRTN
ncbi:MAG: hypothetical protein AB7S41_01350 [Parvibaculaceae bacterium]